MRRCHDRDEWIGIYDSLAQLESAYKASVLEQEHKPCKENSWTTEHEKVMINVFGEATGQWHYDIPYEALFPGSDRNGCPCNEYKVVKIWLDHVDMFLFKREMIKQSKKNYVCDGTPSRGL